MINIDIRFPDDEAWLGWCNDCLAEKDELIKSHAVGIKVKVKDLYKKQKEFFVSCEMKPPFFGKCAYCETLIIENQPGDIEHYRPKKGVTEGGKVVMLKDSTGEELIDGEGKPIPHPGYYWLSYDHTNLLPVCTDCNRPNSKNNIAGKTLGKHNEFPVKGFRASNPDEEKDEEPLLLNPGDPNMDIDEHMRFNSAGIVECLSEEATVTCEILGLNAREGLIQRRLKAYKEGLEKIKLLISAVNNSNDEDHKTYLAEIAKFQEGKEPFSAAARSGIKEKIVELKAKGIIVDVKI